MILIDITCEACLWLDTVKMLYQQIQVIIVYAGIQFYTSSDRSEGYSDECQSSEQVWKLRYDVQESFLLVIKQD